MELLYSVNQLFTKYLNDNDCKYYNIPEYQRGYKWTKNNVTQLLNDIFNFEKTRSDDFYCLQNITIVKIQNVDGHNYFNVIDGQQRLTTLYILLSFFNHICKKVMQGVAVKEMIKYSVRESTHEFLMETVYSGKIWDNIIKPDEMATKDQYYIAIVCDAIQEWFKQMASDKIYEYSQKLLSNVKVIVNKVAQGEEEAVFAGLNGGKIELDGADLVRAILITRVSKQKYPHEKDLEQREGFRIKLGIELDQLNLWWSQKDVISFFEQILPNNISKNKKFEYSKYPIDLLYQAFFLAYRGQIKQTQLTDLDIRHFEYGLDLNGKPGDDYLELYSSLSDFNMTMVDWYENDEIYNLLGYLMSNFKSSKISFVYLWQKWLECKSKSEFKDMLKTTIKEQLTRRFIGTDENVANSQQELSEQFNKLLDAIKTVDGENKVNWYDNAFTTTLLPVADLLPVTVKIKNTERTSIKRLCILDFKRNDEDKEHIRSRTRNITDRENPTDEEKKLLEEENNEGLNSIGNIVLLHEKVNRSYGNAKLVDKMNRILAEAALADIHIRPYTYKVFKSKLENLNDNGLDDKLFWSIDDIKNTAQRLGSELETYLSTDNGRN